MKNQRASRIGIGIGLKSNILVAQQAIDLSKFLSQMPFSSTESSIVEAPKRILGSLRTRAGMRSRSPPPFSTVFTSSACFIFYARPALDHAHSRSYLFSEHFLEHQRHSEAPPAKLRASFIALQASLALYQKRRLKPELHLKEK